MTTLIKGARIIDPATGYDAVGDILIKNGSIAAVGSFEHPAADEVIEAVGLVAAPGLIDIHVHLRDPGFEYKEDILTGARAGAAGGFTGLVCMPNTKPVIDSVETIKYIKNKAEGAAARVYPIAAVTEGEQGDKLCDFTALARAGAVAFSDDGRPVENAAYMQRAMREADKLGLLVASHCEDLAIIDGGIMHRGTVSEQLGVKGMDRASEDCVTARDIAIAAADGTPVHICHVSTAGSAALIRDAKARGVRVTCETAPHYLLLTHEQLTRGDANCRMNPPLREEADRLAMIEAVRDGTVDAIVTDHAPHSPEEKANFETAPNGIIGLETSFAAAHTALVEGGVITLSRLIELMSTAPARLMKLPGGSLKVGEPADIVLLDPTERWVFTEGDIHSKSRNTPFIGTEFTGRVRRTLLAGKTTFSV